MSASRRIVLPLLSGVLLLAVSASARASTVVAEGVLRDGAGLPSAGSVRLYAWPHHDAAMSLPLVGEAQVDVTGRYSIRALDDRQLAALAAQRDGWLDFIAYADTPGHQGQRVFTSSIAGKTRAVGSLAPQHVSGGGGAVLASGGGRVPSIDITTDQRIDSRGRLAQVVGGEPVGRCKNETQTQPTERRTAWTVVVSSTTRTTTGHEAGSPTRVR